jgi:hypothetical protein
MSKSHDNGLEIFSTTSPYLSNKKLNISDFTSTKKLTGQSHIKAKRRRLELKVRNMYWLRNKKSQLSLGTK